MKSRSVFITATEWFESTSLRNPIICMDHKLEQVFPVYYTVNYDTKLLATKAATKNEKKSPFYNDYREQYGSTDAHSLDEAIIDSDKRYVFFNGFDQDQFMHIAPKLKDTAEILYFFKCPKICDLSVLSQFVKLKCVHIYWNNSLEGLWDMTDNIDLKVLSCIMMSKLSRIETLKTSCVEYVCLDSSDNSGQKKKAQFDLSVFDQMNYLKHLSLGYSDCNIDY
ncbi:MAG: hypothetical protein IKV35_01755 [Clostridia bacterium]|nr:hypothetical protein [Clostridia bacterium]